MGRLSCMATFSRLTSRLGLKRYFMSTLEHVESIGESRSKRNRHFTPVIRECTVEKSKLFRVHCTTVDFSCRVERSERSLPLSHTSSGDPHTKTSVSVPRWEFMKVLGLQT